MRCCCFFIAWHVATAHARPSLYFRRARRLAIAIVGIMDCYELIDEVLSCSGRTAGLRHYEVTVGNSLVALARRKAATPDAVAEQQQGQEEPDT